MRGPALLGLLTLGAVAAAGPAAAQAPGDACGSTPAPSYCSAVRGARAEGWPAQSRSEVMAQHGVVVTSQPLAAQVGLQILKRGGNAVDAAVATAAMLNLVEPMMVGMGGDLFAVIYVAKEKKVYVLNASGKAPSGATVARFKSLGYEWNPKNWGPGSGMPVNGILPVTVPGAAWGWQAVEKRFGRLTFKETLEPAADYAEHGFPVSERISTEWVMPNALPLKKCCTQPDPDSIKTWYVDGAPPKAGQIFKNPDLARTFRLLERQGADAFYKGEIAKAIVAKSNALGGTMTLQDLAEYQGEWVEPARSEYRGFEILELPPPSQSWATEEILNILKACVPKWAPGQTLASLGPGNPKYWHFLVEAKKLAYADLYRFNADPDFEKVPLARLLSDSYAATLCARVDADHASTPGPHGNFEMSGDTIVLSTADAEGNMVSWVNSNFVEFGSGLTVPNYGFVLHDRGALFTLDPKSPNAIAPHKRPFNTLSAGFVLKNGDPFMTVTLMGGDMQAQGHAQLLVDVLDLGANVQAAADMARFRHSQVPNVLSLEAPLYDLVGPALTALGHTVKSITGEQVGGVQVILRDRDTYRAGIRLAQGRPSRRMVSLLAADEPAPFIVERMNGGSNLVIVVDHAARRIPRALGDLGLPPAELQRHIAWDIGALEVARRVSLALDAPLVAQSYSRLVIDCNRDPSVETSIPKISEACEIPGNQHLSAAEAQARRREIFDPYHARIRQLLDARAAERKLTILVAQHTMTDVYHGVRRPMHAAVLYNRDRRFAAFVLEMLRRESELSIADNQPYFVSDATDYTIPRHGEGRALPHVEIEIRQDLVGEPAGQAAWAERIARALRDSERRFLADCPTAPCTGQ